MKRIILSLRGNMHQVEVLRPEGENRPVLGVSQPQEEDSRIAILRQWGINGRSPREQPLEGIDEPLPQRTQTILSHRVAPELRQRLNGGMGEPAASRRDSKPGSEGTHTLDQGD